MKKKTVLVAVLALVLVLLVGLALWLFGGGDTDGEQETQPTATVSKENVAPGTPTYQPTDMTGTWVMTAAGAPDDLIEVSRDRGTVEITGDTVLELTVSYTDNETPEDCFYQKPLMPWAGEMYPDCGNSAWAADVDYTGENDTVFVLTLRDDGTLLMQISFQFEGIDVVSYRTFARAE